MCDVAELPVLPVVPYNDYFFTNFDLPCLFLALYSRNQLMELPVCLDKLTSLVSLLAGHNQLTSLHGNLAMCSNVEKLVTGIQTQDMIVSLDFCLQATYLYKILQVICCNDVLQWTHLDTHPAGNISFLFTMNIMQCLV